MNIKSFKQAIGATFVATLINACGGGEQVTLTKYTVAENPLAQKEFYEVDAKGNKGAPRKINGMTFFEDMLYIAVQNDGVWQGTPGGSFTRVADLSENKSGAGPKEALSRNSININGTNVEVDEIMKMQSYPGWLVAQSQYGSAIIDKSHKVWGTIEHTDEIADFAIIKGKGDHEFLVTLLDDGSITINDLSKKGAGGKLLDSKGQETVGQFLAVNELGLVVIGAEHDLLFSPKEIDVDGKSSMANGERAILNRSKIGITEIDKTSDSFGPMGFYSTPSGAVFIPLVEGGNPQPTPSPTGMYTWLPGGTYQSPLVGGAPLVDFLNGQSLRELRKAGYGRGVSVYGEDVLALGLFDNSIHLYHAGREPVVFGPRQSLEHRFLESGPKPSSGFVSPMPNQNLLAAAKLGDVIYYIGLALGELSLNTITIEEVTVTLSK